MHYINVSSEIYEMGGQARSRRHSKNHCIINFIRLVDFSVLVCIPALEIEHKFQQNAHQIENTKPNLILHN